MKKRLLSVALCLCLLVGLLPMTVSAEGAHTHCVCGGTVADHAHDSSLTWSAWDDNDALPTDPGSYYLTTDVTLAANWKPTGTTNLCLNGHKVTLGEYTIFVGDIEESEGPKLSISDCTNTKYYVKGICLTESKTFELHDAEAYEALPDQTGYTELTGGVITGFDTESQSPLSLVNGGFNLYGGNFAGNYSGYGAAAINVGTGGSVGSTTFNMYGGALANNTSASPNSGAVLAGGDHFNMYGGTITGNLPAGVYVANGTDFTLSGAPDLRGNKLSVGDSADVDIALADGALFTVATPLTVSEKISVRSLVTIPTYPLTITTPSSLDASIYFAAYAPNLVAAPSGEGDAQVVQLTNRPNCLIDYVAETVTLKYDNYQLFDAETEGCSRIMGQGSITNYIGQTLWLQYSYTYDPQYPRVQVDIPARPAAPTDAPTFTTRDTTLTITNPQANYQYRLTGGDWQSTASFTGLTPATEYTVEYRTAATGKAFASEAAAVTVCTNYAAPAANQGWTIAYTGDTPQFQVAEGYEVSAASDFGTLIGEATVTAGTTYYVRKAASADSAIGVSAGTPFTVEKMAKADESAFVKQPETLEDRGDATLGGVIADYEYQMEGGAWQSGNGETIENPENKTIFVRTARDGQKLYGDALAIAFTPSTEKLTVALDGNENTEGTTADIQVTQNGGQLTANGYSKTGAQFAGWNDQADGTGTSYADGAWYTPSRTATGSVTLYAQWVAEGTPVYQVTGTLTGTASCADVRVTLIDLDGKAYVAAVSDEDSGSWSYTAYAPAGNYQLVAEALVNGAKVTATSVVTVGADMVAESIALPAGPHSSTLEADAPILVGGLDKLATEGHGEGEVVDVTMTITEAPADPADAEQSAIAGVASDQILQFFHMTLEKTVDGTADEDIGTTNTVLLEILLPYDTSRTDITVYRFYNGAAEALTKDPAAGAEGFTIGDGYVTIYAKAIATYAIGYRENTAVMPGPSTFLPPIFDGELPFQDVLWNDWFYDEVKEAYHADLIDGVTPTLYKPYDDLTLAQAIKLAAALHQLDTWGKVTLTNGSPNWYDSYVDYAVANGVIEGKYQYYGAAQMNAPVSRREFVHIFYGAMPESSYYGWNVVADNAIPDVKTWDACADEIYTFYRAGILTGGKADGSFLPNSNIKRSEVAAILIRMYDTGARQSVYLP